MQGFEVGRIEVRNSHSATIKATIHFSIMITGAPIPSGC